jgi:hypothetical protein
MQTFRRRDSLMELIEPLTHHDDNGDHAVTNVSTRAVRFASSVVAMCVAMI